MEAKNLKVQGLVLLDVDVVALNNAGKNTISNFDNAVGTKKIYKSGRSYVYVSGQAWRYWWRDSLQKNMGWKLSPITRQEKVAFTDANPVSFADDDVFGYMRAAKEEVIDEKGKAKKKDVTVTRVSPLKNSAIISAYATRPVENWSSMARQNGDSVPYSKEEYSAVMKGMFSLDLSMVGTFSNYNKTGFQNLSDKLKEEALKNGAKLIPDSYVAGQELVQLPLDVRKQRAVDTISALKYISGGAMQTNNMGDVTPKFIVLATTNTGNHPFSHIVSEKGEKDEQLFWNVEALKEVLSEYKETFEGKIFIGKRAGFMDEWNESLATLKNEYKEIVEVGAVNEIIDKYCNQLKDQMA
ncbi:MAG: type I-B CRISPR-associated protein Cas7/Cst2/DevR [Bacteroides sp.]|nr:type I-B CRISPR-associated protein Cas7/Cst2/DevR [Bacteroides sp.]MCM1084849.1 type I-B CRISPR-associated protein Cas7/Cst2/DevR [Bacteroides sp.]